MIRQNMKRKMAAVLSAAMLCSGVPFTALGEAAALVQTAYTRLTVSAEAVEDTIVVRAGNASNPVIYATLDGSVKANMNGTKHTFTGVSNGEHTVQVRYNAPDAGEYASDVITVVVNYTKSEPEAEEAEPVTAAVLQADTAAAAIVPVQDAPAADATEPVQQAPAPAAELEQQAAQVEKASAELIATVAPAATDATAAATDTTAATATDTTTGTVTDTTAATTDATAAASDATAAASDATAAASDATAAATDATAAVTDTTAATATDTTAATTDTTEPVYSEINADVKVSGDSITVTITQGSAEAMYIAVGEDWKMGLHKGDSATFSGLAAGDYDVEVDYENGTNVFRTTATVEEQSSNVTTGDATTDDATTGDATTDGTTTGDTTTGDTTTGDTTTGDATTGDTTTDNTTTGGDAQAVKAFTILPVVTDGAIAVVISGASSREVEVVLLDKDGKQIAASASIGDGLVQLGTFASGSYTVRAQYVTPTQDANGNYDFKTVTAAAVVPDGVTAAPAPSAPVNIAAKVETGKDYIIVTVTDAADMEMIVSVEGVGDQTISKGGSVRFEGLTPGASYGVEIDYVNLLEGTTPYRGSVTIPAPAALGEIKITGVTPGVNLLTVSGTATANQQLLITTTPAAAGDVYVMTNESGAFSAQVSCAAGTYTAVTARYVADAAKSAGISGAWVVSAPAAKPTLTVDAVDTTSTTVVGKTTAGVVVEIKASDYTQKVTADENGIVRFSLPHTYAAGTKLTLVVYYGNAQSFTQEITVSNVPYLGTLEYGDTGDAVKKLTRRLKELGYPVDETSRYGSTVREAVRLFQRANGIDDDGIAGPDTQRALFSVSAIAYGSTKYPTLVRGDRGYALIYTLQQRLKDLGYYTIKVDGIFGSGTQRAVREFQRVNGLSVTGKADNATQTLLYSSSAKPASSGVSGEYQTLSRSGKYKSKVVPLQRRLKALGYYSGSIDGYFGSQTYRAVRNFQSRNGLTVTGVADPYTQQVLYSSAAKAASSSSSSSSGSTSTGYRLLYWGCRGDAVTKLQKALIDAGYKSYVRTADGIFGQWTYDAVRAYQKDHGLSVDGIAGKNTQNALYGTNY